MHAKSMTAVCAVALGVVLTFSPFCSALAQRDFIVDSAKDKSISVLALANDILNRWEAVAVAAGVHTSMWREVLHTQLMRMDFTVLARLHRVGVNSTETAKANYASFAAGLKGALVQTYTATRNDKGPTKLGSTTTDQVFVPITPCRVVDTRNVGGPINHGTARNFYFWTEGPSGDWSSQGGPAGSAAATCPGTVQPNAGAGGPSAAVATITAVNTTGAGNFVAWSGLGPTIPTSSVLNWSPGNVIANTTVIPAGARTGNGPGGPIADFAIYLNGPTGSANVVVDVVGYLVENHATPLDCFNLFGDGAREVFGYVVLDAPSCNAGYTRTGGGCFVSVVIGQTASLMTSTTQCVWVDQPASIPLSSYGSETVCCRLPGR